jgi:hypothetical protein
MIRNRLPIWARRAGMSSTEDWRNWQPHPSWEGRDWPLKPRRKAVRAKDRAYIFKRDKNTCQYCRRKPPEVVITIDHLISVDDGGPNNRWNLVACCTDCNLRKGRRSIHPVTMLISIAPDLPAYARTGPDDRLSVACPAGIDPVPAAIQEALSHLFDQEI